MQPTEVTRRLNEIFRQIQGAYTRLGLRAPATSELKAALDDLMRQSGVRSQRDLEGRGDFLVLLAQRLAAYLQERDLKGRQRTGGQRAASADPKLAQALATLGLPPQATFEQAQQVFNQIKKEYRRAITKVHPDVSDCDRSVSQQLNAQYDRMKTAFNQVKRGSGR
jgi:hypothetical protein